MKICVDAREFIEHRKTGIARHLENLLAHLSGKSDLEFILFVNDPSSLPSSLRLPSVKCVTIPSAPSILVDQLILPKLAEKENCDVFFSPYYKIPLSGSFKRIITVHDIMFLRMHDTRYRIQDILKKFLVAIQLRSAVNKADLILVDSEFSKQDLCDYLPVVSPKIKVLYPGIGPEWRIPVNDKQKKEMRMKYSDGKDFFLYVGNFKPHKNVGLIIDAFIAAEAQAILTDKRLLIVGDDPVNLEKLRVVTALNDNKNLIRICPNVPDSDLKVLYSAADWFITASEYEGFGYPVLEAMACGCPLIYHPCTSLPEVTGRIPIQIEKLEQAAVVSAISKAVTFNKDEKLKLINQDRSLSEMFSADKSAQEFLNIIKHLI